MCTGSPGYSEHLDRIMQFDKRLLAPRHWGSWLGMGLGWLLATLPYPLQMWLGRRLGELAYAVLPGRRHIADVNLRICFPEYTPPQRRTLLREHFRSVGMGALETVICWWAPDAKIERLTDMEGLRHLEEAIGRNRGMILLSAHFTSLELGVRMAQIHLRRRGIVTTAVYKAPHDPVVDYVMRRRRETHIGEASIDKDDVRGLLKALKRGRAVWYAADQKAKNKYSAVLPFFGTPAHTNLALSRLSGISNATVVPFFTLRRADARGYRLVIGQPLDDFPGDDEQADAGRINGLIEDVIRQAPAQYFWLHRRFKGPAVGDPYTQQ